MKSPISDPNQAALAMRDARVNEFNQALARVIQLQSEISSFDFVLGQLNPAHVAHDFGRGAFSGLTIDVIAEKPLLTASPIAQTSTQATSSEAPTEIKVKEPEPKVATSRVKAKGKSKKAKEVSERAKIAASVVHGEAANTSGIANSEVKTETAKRRRTDDASIKDRDSREILNAYFKEKNPQQEITNILRGMMEPVTADTVGYFFRKIYPLNLDRAPALKALYKSRIQSMLAALMQKRLVLAMDMASEDGKRNIRHYLLTDKGRKSVIAETKPDIPQNEAPQPDTDFTPDQSAPEQSSGLTVSF